MNHFVNHSYTTIELNQIRYDLSLIYAKEKLREALDKGYLSDSGEAKYLLDMFSKCYNHYCNMDNDCLLKQIDITRED